MFLGMEKVTLIPGDKVPGWWPTLSATVPAVQRARAGNAGVSRGTGFASRRRKPLAGPGVPYAPLSPQGITRGGSSRLLSHPRVGLMKWSRELSPLHT